MVDLQKARREAAERYLALGMSYLPEGYTFTFRNRLTGCHWGDRRHIEAPKPVTRKALYIWLHECAHAQLHRNNGKVPRHVEEYEAEMWAHARMREHGIPVPHEMTLRAKRYVARKIRQAERAGAKTIDPRARKFASE